MAAEDLRCLVVGVEIWLPQVEVLGPDDNLQAVGYIAGVLKIILNHLGYCYTFVRSPDRAYGLRQPNGTWTGLNGLVHRGEADLIGVAQWVTEERFEDFSVSEYLLLSSLTVAHKRPSLQPDMAGFVKPFDPLVWLLLLVSLVVVLGAAVCVRWHFNRLAPREGADKKQDSFRELQLVAKDSVAWTVDVLLSQSVNLQPRGDSVRVISCLWLLTTLILATVYRANLKAMLILPKLSLPFDSLESLADTDIAVWATTGSLFKEALENAPEGLPLRRVEKNLIKNEDMRSDVKFGLAGLLNGDFAAVIPRMSLESIMHYSFSQKGYCGIYAIRSDVVTSSSMSFVFAKGSPLKGQFDPVIRRLRESGIIEHLYKKQLMNASDCSGRVVLQSLGELRPLALGDFHGVLMLYAGGVALATMSFGLESLLGRLSRDLS
ncbi:glutamate receptor ionotropic, kainate glr-3-like [Penaeus chinensis]|uniref:glutamate receptor ionotropic, kainate glr-3-like n=1 Tax=Penaeus chinensis TaxID=139456 RepID=UPI001FB7AEA3|nr:glutamate receptor ionotropic, kainate glr-3-like [Penaeus chinensis]